MAKTGENRPRVRTFVVQHYQPAFQGLPSLKTMDRQIFPIVSRRVEIVDFCPDLAITYVK
jgi:hypothetical protein